MLRVQILRCSLSYFGEWLSTKNQKHANLDRRSVYQLRLKAVEMLRSSTQLVKSHGDDLGLEYLWNKDEYGSLENSLKAIKNAEYGEQPEILALVRAIGGLHITSLKTLLWRTTRNLSPSACYWWFACDVIKNMTMPIMINFSQVLIWPVRPYNVSLYQI